MNLPLGAYEYAHNLQTVDFMCCNHPFLKLPRVKAWRLGRALSSLLDARILVVGTGVHFGATLQRSSLVQGIVDSGCDVVDLGVCASEEVAFAVSALNAHGGVMISGLGSCDYDFGLRVFGKNAVLRHGPDWSLELVSSVERRVFPVVFRTGGNLSLLSV